MLVLRDVIGLVEVVGSSVGNSVAPSVVSVGENRENKAQFSVTMAITRPKAIMIWKVDFFILIVDVAAFKIIMVYNPE
jgi:hypothetical protein